MNPEINYKQAAIFFFSGTGNAEKVSYWMAKVFQANGIATSVISILKENKPNKGELPGLIGFCAPTHGFNFPPVMMHFLLRFPKSKGKAVFLVNTRAGMKMGKCFLPGLSGMAQYFYALVFKWKGYRIVGMRSIDLPSNWISLHPGLKQTVVMSIMHRCKSISEQFALRIINGKRDLRALFDLVQDVLITPVAFAYYLIGRFILAKTFYADRNCTQCNKCINECPIAAIKKVDKRPFWTYSCESCMHCINNCPSRAIQTAHGFVFAVFYLVIAVIMKVGWNFLMRSSYPNFVDFIYNNQMLKFTVESVVAFVFLLIAYWLMHYLIKIAPIERLISYTSLTSYRFWRRFKGNTIRMN